MSAAITGRLFVAAHRITVLAADFSDLVFHAAHALHRKSLYKHYNVTANQAAYHRKELTDLAANTRDQVLGAKIAYQQAMKAAEDAFNVKVKEITDTHTLVRGVVVGRLDALNTKAREAQEAIELHDALV